MSSVEEFSVNQFISLKLVNDKTEIYVLGELFRQCKFLLINIPVDKITRLSEITSIDEASESLDNVLESTVIKSPLTPQMEFWGHCSNIQAWFENDYNTALLHRNLAFPLLQRLASVGDPIAKMVFKEEIAKRFESGYKPVVKFLLRQGYISYLTNDELESVLPIDIEDLDLSSLRLKTVPKWVRKLRFLKSLNLANNLLSKLPEWFRELNQLQKVNLANNPILSVPTSLMNLLLLEDLNLSRTKIKILPEWLGGLSLLKKLD